jgi:phage terminase large subunit-like protein
MKVVDNPALMNLTPGQLNYLKTMAFLETHVYVPDGPTVGQQMRCLPEQRKFVRDVYMPLDDNGKRIVRSAIFSCGRKNGKTMFMSGLAQAHIFGPQAKQNSRVYGAARSRDQAAILYDYAAKSIRMNPKLEGVVRLSDATKTIHGIRYGVQYRALSAEATTAYGLNPAMTIHDELGQVHGPEDALFDALDSASGAQDEPLSIILSTQAATDGDLLSLLIDDALSSGDPSSIVHLYTTPKNVDPYDEANWYAANFALGKHRSLTDMRKKAEQAQRLPGRENLFRNLYLNQRVSALSSFISETLWRSNADAPKDEWFHTFPVHVGLDLSARTDLTAVVLAVHEPESRACGLRTYVFTPTEGLEERARTDRASYLTWMRQGNLIATPGRVVDYEYVINFMKRETEGMPLASINYDRWRISILRKEAERADWATDVQWNPVGQGYKDMSPCLETFEALALEGRIRHGGHPALTAAVLGSAVVSDPAGNRKLEKSKSTARIDAIVAGVMAAQAACGAPETESAYDISFI